MPNIENVIAQELGISPRQVAAVVALVDEGNTIPFIARYRKEATGGLDDVTLRDLDERLAYLRALEARKADVLRTIDEQGKLTDALRAKIEEATVMQRVEDLYKPYRKKRATRASKARDAGLEPLALLMIAQATTNGDPRALAAGYAKPGSAYDTPETVLAGARDIVAEALADDAEHVAALRAFTRRQGSLAAEATDPEERTVYDTYYGFAEPLTRIPNHRILAINRGEKEGKLRVHVRADADAAVALLEKRVVRHPSIFADQLRVAVADGYKRLVAPALERELRAELTERAQADAIRVFARNTESLLSQRPVRGARVIALDPGYRTGCKVAVLDEYGALLDHGTVFPTPPRSDVAGTKRALAGYVRKHRANVVVIGNGTGSRETEEVVVDFIAESGADVRYTIVNEAGASVYSASKLASEEYPDLDVTTRGAMSLGRRLQDPLAELREDPATVHRRRPVPARPECGRARARAHGRGGERGEPRGRRPQHGQPEPARLRGRREHGRGEKHRGLPRGTRRVHRPPPAQEGSEARREGVPELRRLPAHLGRQEPARRHERPPRKLRCGARRARARRHEA